MSQRIRDGGRIASAGALSVAVHGVLVGIGAALFAGSLASSAPEIALAPMLAREVEQEIELDLPAFGGDGENAGSATHLDPIAPQRGGGEGTPRPDMGQTGRGGTDTAAEPALNLADRDEGLFLSPEVQSRLDRSQIQRIQSARERASREDWRASREPMELTFLASGRAGERPERRRSADADPSAGAWDRGAPERLGGAVGSREIAPGFGESPRPVGGAVEGGPRVTQGLGVRDGAPGHDNRGTSAVAYARPLVAQGTPSVPANVEGRPNDTVDSEQEVATAIQAIVHASTAGGAQGAGSGGQAGPGAAGSGGVSGGGSSAKALGTGSGAGIDNSASDRRRSLYIRQVRSKVDPLWANAFPKWAALEGLQGTAIVTFVIRGDGSVASASVTRPSGIPEFDENCRRAVLRGAPFLPLPSELGQSLRMSMSFDMQNPAVTPRR
jgi:TonB family protein